MYVKVNCSEKVAPVSALHSAPLKRHKKNQKICVSFIWGHAAHGHLVGRCLKLGPHVGIIWAVAGQFQPPFL